MNVFIYVVFVLCCLRVVGRLEWLGSGVVPAFTRKELALQCGFSIALAMWAVVLMTKMYLN